MQEQNRLASALAEDTAITFEEARSLIEMIGTDRNALLREAHMVTAK